MKKISQLYREALEVELTKRFEEDSNIFFIHYAGLSAAKLSDLRSNLRQSGARMLITKNTLSKRALDKIKLGHMAELINGPVGLVFVGKDPVAVSKVLVTFKKEAEKLDFLGGFWQDKKITDNEIRILAQLSPKPVLQAKCVGLIKFPLNNLVWSLNGILVKLVLALKAINDKKRGG
ncbi:MAG: 50S ribosomal protein L10 [Candidatus Omnitrophota bacterium]